MNKKLRLATPILSALLICAPVFAQSQLKNNQPIRGDLHTREATIQAKLKMDYKQGRIDSTELASFQRDLDGILVRENDFKGRADGLTDSGRETIFKSLDVFEARLDRHANKSNVKTAADPVKVGN